MKVFRYYMGIFPLIIYQNNVNVKYYCNSPGYKVIENHTLMTVSKAEVKKVRNKYINSSSFSEKFFTKLKRPTKILLTSILFRRNFTYLDQKAFLPFLTINNENTIDNGEYLNCSDCRNHWVQSNPDLIKRVKVSVDPARCENFIQCKNETVTDQEKFENGLIAKHIS